jgi:hypothetical protein
MGNINFGPHYLTQGFEKIKGFETIKTFVQALENYDKYQELRDLSSER